MSHNHHQHHHHHHHDHHDISPGSYNFSFVVAVLLNAGFVIIEFVFAIIANSMSLLADAGHNLGDVLGLIFAGIANWLLTKKATEQYSYGYKRSSIIAALANALLLVAVSALITYESIWNLMMLEEVNEKILIIVSLLGIFINGGTALLFMKGRHHDLNIRGAFLHLAYDALISAGVVITGLLIAFTGHRWFDPVVGLLIVGIIFYGTWGLLRDSVNLIMDAVPRNVSVEAVTRYLGLIPGVCGVHDLHIWGLSTRDYALTAHLIMPTAVLYDEDLLRINRELHEKFNINHVTIQVEQGSQEDPCGQTVTC